MAPISLWQSEIRNIQIIPCAHYSDVYDVFWIMILLSLGKLASKQIEKCFLFKLFPVHITQRCLRCVLGSDFQVDGESRDLVQGTGERERESGAYKKCLQ